MRHVDGYIRIHGVEIWNRPATMCCKLANIHAFVPHKIWINWWYRLLIVIQICQYYCTLNIVYVYAHEWWAFVCFFLLILAFASISYLCIYLYFRLVTGHWSNLCLLLQISVFAWINNYCVYSHISIYFVYWMLHIDCWLLPFLSLCM